MAVVTNIDVVRMNLIRLPGIQCHNTRIVEMLSLRGEALRIWFSGMGDSFGEVVRLTE